ncbi:glutaredoxin family protein [Alkalicoccobacillus porphyridii]|nr:glutaredoxin family protein [Alkalicoccobacillus porphyridii]
MHLIFYSKENCSICDKGLQTIESLKKEFTFTLEYVDIYSDDQLLEQYMWRIPVVKMDGKVIDEGILSTSKLRSSFPKT